MERTTISLSKEEMQYIEILLLEDAFKIRKKLDDDIEESNKEGILIDFKNFVSNNSIKTKIICGREFVKE